MALTLEELQAQVNDLTLKLQQRDILLENMKGVKDNFNKMREFLLKKGIDPDTNPEDSWSNVIGQKEQAKKTLEQQLSDLTGKFNDLNNKYEQATKEATNGKIKSSLKGKLNDIIGADDLIELLVLQNKVDIKGDDIFYRKSDAEAIKFDDFLTEYKTKNAERVRVQHNGGNQPPAKAKTNTNDNSGNSKVMKYTDYIKLDSAAQQKALQDNITIENE